MTVAHDAYSEMAAEARGPGNPQAHTWTHTPTGTPAAVLVWVTTSATLTNAADNMVTAVTYGGVAMTKVREVHGTGSEPGSTWLYELLAAIPAGAQTVSATVLGFPTSNTANYPWIMGLAVTMTSGGGVIVRADDDEIVSTGLTNPSVTMDAGANTGISYLGGFSARPDVASITAATNCTIVGSHDWTNSDDTAVVIQQTTPAAGTFAIGYTAASDDVFMAAATYYEIIPVTGRYLLESGSPDGYLQEDGAGVLLGEDATDPIEADAEQVTGTGAIGTPSTSIAFNAGQVTGTGAIGQSNPNVQPVAGQVTGTGAIGAATITTTATAGQVTGTGAIGQASTSVVVNAAQVTGTGAVGDSTVSTEVISEADAEQVAGLGAIGQAAASIAPNAGSVTGTGQVGQSRTSLTATAGQVTGTGAVGQSAASVAPAAGQATGTGQVGNATITVVVNAAAVTGLGAIAQAWGAVAPSAAQVTGSGAVTDAALLVAPSARQVTGTGAVGNATVQAVSASTAGLPVGYIVAALSVAGYVNGPAGTGAISGGVTTPGTVSANTGTGSMSGGAPPGRVTGAR